MLVFGDVVYVACVMYGVCMWDRCGVCGIVHDMYIYIDIERGGYLIYVYICIGVCGICGVSRICGLSAYGYKSYGVSGGYVARSCGVGGVWGACVACGICGVFCVWCMRMLCTYM